MRCAQERHNTLGEHGELVVSCASAGSRLARTPDPPGEGSGGAGARKQRVPAPTLSGRRR